MKRLILSLFIVFFLVPVCNSGMLIQAVVSGGSYISEVTLNESTPNAWDAFSGAEGSAGDETTSGDTSARADIKAENFHWYIARWDVFGAGGNQIPASTTAAEINDATLTLTFYAGRDGESGDTISVDAVVETFAWSGWVGDGVTFDKRNDGTAEANGIAAGAEWESTGSNLDDALSGNAATHNLTGSDTSIEIDVTDIVKYWCNNPTLIGFTIELSAISGTSAVEYYTFDGTTPPFIVVNDGL